MAKYDLTNSLETSFTFTIGDKEFAFRKPTVREMRTVQKRFSSIDKEDNADKQIEMSDNAMREIYKFVNPINHDSSIEEVLSDQTVDVQIAFNNMVKKELGASQ